MKLLTIEVVSRLGDHQFEVAGRCCRDSIAVGDELVLSEDYHSRFTVTAIEAYHRSVDSLAHGYVGTIWLDSCDAREPSIGGTLVDSDSLVSSLGSE